MAHKLSDEHKLSGNDKTPVMICVLNGAFIFFSDLVKDMGIEIEVDFIRAKSYSGMDNSGGVTFTKEIETDLTGKRVYIVDDMVDTGKTMVRIESLVNQFDPKKLDMCTVKKFTQVEDPLERVRELGRNH